MSVYYIAGIYSWVRDEKLGWMYKRIYTQNRVWLRPLIWYKYLHMRTPFCCLYIKYLFRTIRAAHLVIVSVNIFVWISLTHPISLYSLPLPLCGRRRSLSEHFSSVTSDENVPSCTTHPFVVPSARVSKKKSYYEKCTENDWLGTYFRIFLFRQLSSFNVG